MQALAETLTLLGKRNYDSFRQFLQVGLTVSKECFVKDL